MAVAAAWASQVTGIATEMVVPPMLGLWVDRKLGTGFVFVTLGGILGFYAALRSLLRMAKVTQGKPSCGAGNHHAPTDDRGAP